MGLYEVTLSRSEDKTVRVGAESEAQAINEAMRDIFCDHTTVVVSIVDLDPAAPYKGNL